MVPAFPIVRENAKDPNQEGDGRIEASGIGRTLKLGILPIPAGGATISAITLQLWSPAPFLGLGSSVPSVVSIPSKLIKNLTPC
ncbi:hypothetical protein CRG98_013167 [Punica granatum]|uniref:Uncharacterized protein n=1 Tax=Punica granatum TaxID=22663 RepID=A0A2I0KCW2_PUNGR|nr:hypothetical protein CRG98_013167 [Punica granatum]